MSNLDLTITTGDVAMAQGQPRPWNGKCIVEESLLQTDEFRNRHAGYKGEPRRMSEGTGKQPCYDSSSVKDSSCDQASGQMSALHA